MIRKIITWSLIGIFGTSSFFLAPQVVSLFHSYKQEQILQEFHSSKIEEESFTKEDWKKLSQVNADFVGYLEFDSGLLHQPIVLSKDNKEYLNQSFQKEYTTQGTVFMDKECTLDDQNITLYGHYVYYDSSVMFSPLETLLNQEMYEDNRFLTWYLEDEIRHYEMISIYHIYYSDLDHFLFYQSQFSSPEEFHQWIQVAKDRNMISPKNRVKDYDNILTLQTCKRGDDQTHVLVLFKELERVPYKK